MSRTSLPRGFTLLEVMIASAIGIIVLGVGLVAGMQIQRRALFEEQTMTAQVTARAVKDLLAADLQRAGSGMGNTPITFADGDSRFAIQVWTDLDLAPGLAPFFTPDATFSRPPAGSPYAGLTSDVLQLYWGDTRSMLTMEGCGGPGTRIRPGASANFCTAPNPPLDLEPPNGQSTPAIIVNPQGGVACHVQISQVMSAAGKINANPGSAFGNTGVAPCGVWNDAAWEESGWVTMRTQSAAYRVNWASGIPTLESRPPVGGGWVTVSQNVERMKLRQAVIDLSAPNAPYRWFPDAAAGRPAIDRCTLATCTVDPDPAPAGAPTTDAELVRRLQQRVREVEVSLVIRTQRPDRTAPLPAGPLPVDEEGFLVDGFKRRTMTFRVAPRNFGVAGLQPAAGGGP